MHRMHFKKHQDKRLSGSLGSPPFVCQEGVERRFRQDFCPAVWHMSNAGQHLAARLSRLFFYGRNL
jgi:hypothetical protein